MTHQGSSEAEANIPEGWHRIPLGQIVTFQRGYDLPLKEKKEGNYPIVASNGIIGYHNQFKAKGPGVTVGRSGNLGKPFFVEEDYWPHNTTLYVTEFHKSDPSFVYYFLKTLNLAAFNAGSAVPTLNRNHIHTLQVVIPREIREQRNIANTLSKLDKKIKLNCEMNATLEAIGQAVFKRWFVDFEFPNEEGKPYKSSGGEMVESEKGRIPNVWGVAELNSFGRIICGKTPPKASKEFFGGDVPFIKIPDMHNQLFIINTEDTLTDKGRRYQANKSIPPNSICVSCIATVGLVSITTRESHTNQQINCIVPHEEFFMPYLFYVMKSLKRELEDLGSGGSATLNVNTNTFSSIRLIAPKTDVMKEFCRITAPLLTKIRANPFENRTLSQIRDSLLPRLMSGKIRVPNNKEEVEIVGNA